MADNIKIDTGQVVSAANNIADYNNRLLAEFSSVDSAMKSVESDWVSGVAGSTIGAFNAIKKAYLEPRHQVVNNFVAFLKQQVDPGYTQTETVNESLADKFK
jgi:hypothetical protein